MNSPITTIFLDLGGVVLTNGWDHNARRRAAETFGLEYEEMNERHHLTFDTYEEGKLSLDEYLNRVVFYESRPFSTGEFKNFMFDQTHAYPRMIDLVRSVKDRYKLKVAAVSNEGRELSAYRTRTFRLSDFIDFFVVSCFVHFRKPDADIYRIALDIAQVTPAQVLYLEDRAMFVEVARNLGINGVLHKNYESTRDALEALGLSLAQRSE